MRSKTKALARLSGAKAYAVTVCVEIARLLLCAVRDTAALRSANLQQYHTRET